MASTMRRGVSRRYDDPGRPYNDCVTAAPDGGAPSAGEAVADPGSVTMYLGPRPAAPVRLAGGSVRSIFPLSLAMCVRRGWMSSA